MLRWLKHLPASALLLSAVATFLPSAVSAAPWQRRSLLGSPLTINLRAPDLRSLDASGPADLPLWNGRILLRAPGLSPSELSSIAPAIEARLKGAFDASWNVSISQREPIRLMLLSSPGAPLSQVFSLEASEDGGSPDRDPVVALNVSGQTEAEIAAEALRDVGTFVLRRLAPGTDDVLVSAAARALSLSGDLLESDRAEIREAGASPENSLERPEGEIFAAAWIDEMSAQAGPGFLSSVWTRRVSAGEGSLLTFAQAFSEATHGSAWDALRRSLERAYSRSEVLGDLARLTDQDRADGALDASRPGALAWRFFSSEISAAGGMSVSWPQDGASGFAVLHYEDSLPSDVVPFSAGDTRVLPLSGVSRIDWVVSGDGEAAASLAAPVVTAAVGGFPVSGLTARAVSAPGEGISLAWDIARQQNLTGWAILRSEVDESGRVEKASPQWIPSQSGQQEQAEYSFVDSTAASGRYYRYDVWAVTADGALSRSFQTTIRAR